MTQVGISLVLIQLDAVWDRLNRFVIATVHKFLLIIEFDHEPGAVIVIRKEFAFVPYQEATTVGDFVEYVLDLMRGVLRRAVRLNRRILGIAVIPPKG